MAPVIGSYRVSRRAADAARELSGPGCRYVLFGCNEPSLIWYLRANEEVQIVRKAEDFLRQFKAAEPVCAIVHKDKLDKLTAAGFDSTADRADRWVEGINLDRWRKEELWVGVNKAGTPSKDKSE